MSDRIKGTVKWFNETKGFGFIVPENGGNDIFVHISAVQASPLNTLNDGDQVEFSIKTGNNGRDQADQLSAA